MVGMSAIRRQGVQAGGPRRGIFNYGDAQFYGSTGRQPLNAPIVGLASRSSSTP